MVTVTLLPAFSAASMVPVVMMAEPSGGGEVRGARCIDVDIDPLLQDEDVVGVEQPLAGHGRPAAVVSIQPGRASSQPPEVSMKPPSPPWGRRGR